jgi:D-alanyl-D-alanine carboxypeptidase
MDTRMRSVDHQRKSPARRKRKRRRRLRPLPVIVLLAIIVILLYKLVVPICGGQSVSVDTNAEIDKSSYYSMVVNSANPISEYLVPSQLVSVTDEIKLEKQTAAAFTAMVSAMAAKDLEIDLESGYRSYEAQQQLYDKRMNKLKADYPDKSQEELVAILSESIAPPGTSEHQTGLAMDISVTGISSARLHETEAGKWIAKHGAEYGFIFRYPAGKEEATGTIHEPWHLRYVGTDLAKELQETGLTLDEYFGKEVNK